MLTILSVLRALSTFTLYNPATEHSQQFYLPTLKLHKPFNSNSSLSLSRTRTCTQSTMTCLYDFKYLVHLVKGITQCLPVVSGLFHFRCFRGSSVF